MARRPVTCPYCGHKFRPPAASSYRKPGIERLCGNCAHLVELVGPPRFIKPRFPIAAHFESMHRCRLSGSPVSPTQGCSDEFKPSQAAIERFERCGV